MCDVLRHVGTGQSYEVLQPVSDVRCPAPCGHSHRIVRYEVLQSPCFVLCASCDVLRHVAMWAQDRRQSQGLLRLYNYIRNVC